MKPGIYKEMDINLYHSSEGISNSGLCLFSESPKKYWYKYLSGMCGIEKPTDDQIFGSAVHTAILEPDEFNNRYFVVDKMKRSGKKWNAVLEAAGNKQVLFEPDYRAIEQIMWSLAQIPTAKQIISNGNAEHSIYFNDADTGALCKARPDYFTDTLVVDIKTTKCAEQNEYSKTVKNYNYHRQAAMILDALSAQTGQLYELFVHIAIEKEPPYLIALYVFDDETIEQGRYEYKKALGSYAECLSKNEWPGYSLEPVDLSLPSWALKRESI